MMDNLKEGTKKTLPTGVLLDTAIDAMVKVMPEWLPLAVLDLFHSSLTTLRQQSEVAGMEALRRAPLMRLDFDVDWCGDEAEPAELARIEAARAQPCDLEEAQLIADKVRAQFPMMSQHAAMAGLTLNVKVIWPDWPKDRPAENGKVLLPPDLKAEVKALPEADRQRRIDELVDGFLFDPIRITLPGEGDHAGEVALDCSTVFRVLPLSFVTSEQRAFYSIIIGLDFKKGSLAAMNKAAREAFWSGLFGALDKIAATVSKKADELRAKLPPEAKEEPIAPAAVPDRILPAPADYIKVPGRMIDTPRELAKQSAADILPGIGDWYAVNTQFNRRVGMAAVALTDYQSSRDAAMKLQEVNLKDFERLVHPGSPAHGQHFVDIMAALVALQDAPVPLVRVEWEAIGGRQKKRFRKKYRVLRSTLFQTTGVVYEDRKTGKRVYLDDPAHSEERIPAKPSRRKAPVLSSQSSRLPAIFQAFPLDKYRVAALCFRWNTDVAEDFIMPQAARTEQGEIRYDARGRQHREGTRFVSVYQRWFDVQERLTKGKQVTASRLLDYLSSEKVTVTPGERRAVYIEVAAEKVFTLLGLRYQSGRRKRVEDQIADAVIELQKEGVILSGSDPWPIEYPEGDRRRARRVGAFYRWKLAREWSTMALVPDKSVFDVEADAVATRKREEAAAAAHEAKQASKPAKPPKTVPLFPEFHLPDVPTGAEVQAARQAAGMSLRAWADAVKHMEPAKGMGPSHKFWNQYENGDRDERHLRQLAPDVLKKILLYVAKNRPTGEVK